MSKVSRIAYSTWFPLIGIVLLQAMKEDPPIDAKCRDKFLVQSVLVDETDEANVSTLWSSIEKTNKSSIQEQKIRVEFLPAGAATPSTPQVNGGLTASEEHPPAYSTSTYGSPAPASDAKSPSGASGYRQVTEGAPMTSAASSPAAPAAPLIPRSQEDLNAQLKAAQAKIQDLTNQLSDPQVRQRKVAEAQEKVQQVVQQTQDTGVPLHITAALCLVSFLIAWLFF